MTKLTKELLNYIGKDEEDIRPEDIFEDKDSTCLNYDCGCSTSGIFELTPENCMTFIGSNSVINQDFNFLEERLVKILKTLQLMTG